MVGMSSTSLQIEFSIKCTNTLFGVYVMKGNQTFDLNSGFDNLTKSVKYTHGSN